MLILFSVPVQVIAWRTVSKMTYNVSSDVSQHAVIFQRKPESVSCPVPFSPIILYPSIVLR